MPLSPFVIPLAVATSGYIAPGLLAVEPLCVATDGYICDIPAEPSGGQMIIPVRECPEGEHWDPILDRCVPDEKPEPDPEEVGDDDPTLEIVIAMAEAIWGPRGPERVALEVAREISDPAPDPDEPDPDPE